METGTVLEAKIAEAKNNCKSIVTITSDDGFYVSGIILAELLEKYKLKASISMPVCEAKKDWFRWMRLSRKSCLEIVNHSYTHKVIPKDKEISQEDFDHEIIDAKNFLHHRYKTDQIVFIPSNCALPSIETERLIAKGIYAIRRAKRGINSLSPEEGEDGWMNMFTIGIGDVSTTDERNAFVDETIKMGGWLIEMWHCVSPNGDLCFQPISTKDADAHLKYIHQNVIQGNVWITGYIEATKYIREKQNYKVKAQMCDGKIHCELQNVGRKLPIREFNDELTIILKVPSNWKNVCIYYKGKYKKVKMFADINHNIVFNMRPSDKVTIEEG
ncbi:MAG: hypothetical protein PHX08_13555 [Lachnospiraceae bacterium]|nr:hypothetical protein [Lachnospiraceae bacterium]